MSTNGGRCGMCGACDSMPPWAPERLRLLSTTERERLLARMAERQRIFKERRDARDAMQQLHRREQEALEETEPNVVDTQLLPDGYMEQALNETALEDVDQVHEEHLEPSEESAQRSTGDMLQQHAAQPQPQQQQPQPQQPQPQAQVLEDSPRIMAPRDTDSDADSFHTAEEDNEPAQPSPTDHEPPPPSSSSSTHQQTALLPDLIQSVDFQHLNFRHTDGEQADPAALSLTTTQTQISTAPQSSAPSPPVPPSSSHHQTLVQQPSENLEDSVSARRPLRAPLSNQKTFLEPYELPPDLVPLRSEISLHSSLSPGVLCADCERWRARVQELELKVEALTSALTAKEMETAAMKARANAARNQRLPKTAAQLMEECENLRFTTEFLFHKLERYEGEEAKGKRQTS